MIRLVVGLGNPGPEYELTRHNIAWLTMDNLSFDSSLNWKSKFNGVYATHNISGETIYFLKPHTFMNLSGKSVQSLCSFFKITAEEILVIHDELDLPYGQISFKIDGGLAGHNGLKSIAQNIGTQAFNRMRMGIGRPIHGSPSAWVLSKFSGNDELVLGNYLSGAAEAIEICIKSGVQSAARTYNKKFLIPNQE